MEDAKARAERERERMGRLTAEQSGRGAETVYRDKSGKRVEARGGALCGGCCCLSEL